MLARAKREYALIETIQYEVGETTSVVIERMRSPVWSDEPRAP
jgi:hypothetical protein